MPRRVTHSKAYDELAVYAGVRCGMKKPTPQAVANRDDSRELRDRLWLEYERMHRDGQTYQLDRDIMPFCKAHGVKASKSSVNRDGLRVREGIKAVKLRAELASAVMDAAGNSGEDVFKAGRLLAGQMIFEALNGMSIVALEDLSADPIKLLRMIDTLGALSRVEADAERTGVEAEMTKAKLAEYHKSAKQEVDRAAKAAGGKGLTRQDVYKILDSVMKGQAA